MMENKVCGKLDSPLFEAFSRSVDQQYIYICDVGTNIWRWSPSAVEYFGLPGEYIQDLPDIWMEKVHPDDRDRVAEEFRKLFGGESQEHSCEYRVLNARSEYQWVLCRGCMISNQKGEPDLCAGVMTNLGSQNKFDSTTGLYSFSEFRKALGQTLRRPGCHGGVLLWGIDHFRRINEAYGYSFGNRLLSAYAKAVGGCVKEGRSLFRMGGDQFAILCPDAGMEDLTGLFQAIRAVSMTGIHVDGEVRRFSITAGAVIYPEHGAGVDDIYSNLEYALETSKKLTRERLTFFTGIQKGESLRRFRLQQLLRESVLDGCRGFSLYYQPLIFSERGELAGAEALLRWSHPEFPQISPAEFIPILEETGDINTVGRWVLTTALSQMGEWLKKRPGMKISVNVSYLQLLDSSFKEFVLEEVERHRFPKGQLMLELTESCNVIHPRELAQQLEELRREGIQIALDDFGTGYASLSVLRDLCADWIKVDHTFVAKIADSDFDQALTEYLINLCTKLGMKVCVEGIETEEIRGIIRQYRPAVLQGYLYSKPVGADEFEAIFIDSDLARQAMREEAVPAGDDMDGKGAEGP